MSHRTKNTPFSTLSKAVCRTTECCRQLFKLLRSLGLQNGDTRCHTAANIIKEFIHEEVGEPQLKKRGRPKGSLNKPKTAQKKTIGERAEAGPSTSCQKLKVEVKSEIIKQLRRSPRKHQYKSGQLFSGIKVVKHREAIVDDVPEETEDEELRMKAAGEDKQEMDRAEELQRWNEADENDHVDSELSEIESDDEMDEINNKGKKQEMTDDGTKLLIQLAIPYEIIKQGKPSKDRKRPAQIWEEISAKLMAEGHIFTAKQCSKRYQKLYSRYKEITDHNKHTGNQTHPMQFIWEEVFNECFGERKGAALTVKVADSAADKPEPAKETKRKHPKGKRSMEVKRETELTSRITYYSEITETEKRRVAALEKHVQLKEREIMLREREIALQERRLQLEEQRAERQPE